MSKFFDDVIAALRDGADLYGSARQLALAADMNPSTVTKWLAEKEGQVSRSPNIRDIGPLMDILGVRVVVGQAGDGGQDGKSSFAKLQKELSKLRQENDRLRHDLEKEKDFSSRLQGMLVQMGRPDTAPQAELRQNKNCA